MSNIYFYRQTNKWMVKVRGVYLGLYNTEDDAKKALQDWLENNPKEAKRKITASLSENQYSNFQNNGGHKWFKKLLEG